MRRLGLFCLAGLLVVVFGVSIGPAKSWAAGYGTYTTAISSGNLLQPDKIAVDSANGDIYVTDAGGGDYAVRKYDKNYNYQFSFSISGSPVGVAVDTNNIFVGDSTNKCVWIYDKTGVLTNLPGTTGNKLPAPAAPAPSSVISFPDSIAIAPSGQIFVADGDNDVVLIYNADGSYNSYFGTSGNTNGYFYFPSGITFANSSDSGTATTQYFYVGDQGNYRVQEFYYVYNDTTKAITTAPTWQASVGAEGDGFGKFLRVSDLAYDSIFNRLLVDDSLQQVVQEFDINGATLNAAFNYSGSATQGYLNTPTGVALGYGNSGQELYVANNQSSNIAVFVANQGPPPSITSLTPAADTVPTATPYTISYTVSDPNAGNLTVKLYYYNVLAPSVLLPLATQTATISTAGGSYNGTFAWNWTAYIGGYNITPPEPTGDWKIYATVTDASGNIATATSSKFSIITDGTSYDGNTWTEPNGANTPNYTNYLYALYGASNTDYDGDGLLNGDELNGTYNGSGSYTDAISGQVHNYNYNNASTDMTKADSDGDGLTDGQEEGRVAAGTYNGSAYYVHTNPNNPNTDGCTLKDGAQVLRQTDPLDTSTCQAPSGTLVGMYYAFGNETSVEGVSTPNQSWTTRFEVSNPTTNSVTGTMTIYDMNGNATNTSGLSFGPHQSIEIDPSTYPNSTSTGSVEIAMQGGILIGNEYMDVFNNNTALEESGPAMLPASKAYTTLYCPLWDNLVNYDTHSRDEFTYLFLKNPNASAVTVSIYVYDMTNTLLNPGGTPINITIPAHGNVKWAPKYAGITATKGNIEIDCPSPVLGYIRYDFWDTNTHIYQMTDGYELFTPNDQVPIYYTSNFYNQNPCNWDATWSTWYSLKSSSSTSINVTADWHDISGNDLGPETKSYTANGSASWTPALCGITALEPACPATTWTTKGTSIITAPTASLLGFTTNYIGQGASYNFQNPIYSGNILYFGNFQATATSSSGFTTWETVMNPNSASVNVTMNWYNSSGSLILTQTKTVAAQGLVSFSPEMAGVATGTVGYAVATSNLPIEGYSTNYDYTEITSGYTTPNTVTAFLAVLHPLAPNGVTTTPASKQITVSWVLSDDDPLNSLSIPKGAMDVTYYYIWRATQYGGPYTKIGQVTAGTSSFVDTTATSGVNYYYKVSATTDGVNSSYSPETAAVQALP